jgi:hypothetical protein
VESEEAPVNGWPKQQPTHHQVADELRKRIKSGKLEAGQRMPTQAQLADEFGVERGTVRQALRALQGDNLLTNVSRGAPATVAPDLGGTQAGPGAAPQPTAVGLAPRIEAAFEAPHVRIDALCLTSVSLTLAIGGALRRIHAGELAPTKVDVRVLLPSSAIALAFPAPVDAATDDRNLVHQHWLTQRNAQGQVLRSNLLGLRSTHGIEVNVSFRALPLTPPLKLYLLNEAEALFAYYTPRRREEEFDHERLEMYDPQGGQSTLFTFEQGALQRDATFVEQSRTWFEALWSTISEELRLSA